MDSKSRRVWSYRQMGTDLEEKVDGDCLAQMSRQIEELGDGQVLSPVEAELESELIAKMSATNLQHVRDCGTSLVTFHPLDFTDRVARMPISENALSAGFWASLGRHVAPWFAPVPSLQFLHGTLPASDAPRPQRQPRARRTPLSQAVSPDQVAIQPTMTATSEEVRWLNTSLIRAYRERGPICFFKFCYHPTSFSATVENVFHLSILVRERRARVQLDSHRLPTVEPLRQRGSDGRQHRAAESEVHHQLLMRIDHAQWQKVVRVFRIRQPVILERPVDAESAAGTVEPPAKRKP